MRIGSQATAPASFKAVASAASIATAARLKWTISSATLAIDDIGHEWNFAADSPAAIAAAVARSVRRWRLARIIRDLPDLLPPASDTTNALSTMLVDFASTVRSMTKGKGPGNKTATE